MRYLACLLLLLACAPPDYFPLRPGTHLAFRAVTIGEQDSAVVAEHAYLFDFTAPRTEPGLGKLQAVEFRRDSGEPSTWYFQRRRDGVWLLLPGVANADVPPVPGWLKVLELPLRAERIWYADAERGAAFELVGFEDVAVPAGNFARCARIRVHTGEARALIDFWLAPGAGLVRWRRRLGAGRVEISELVSV
jgi:hypothetical protein